MLFKRNKWEKENKIATKVVQIVYDPCALLIDHLQVSDLVLALGFMHRCPMICYVVY